MRQAPAHHLEVTADPRRNEPLVLPDERCECGAAHGTRVEIELEGTYKKGRRSVDEYVEQTALANPHAAIFYNFPGGAGTLHFPRASDTLPPEPRAIKPHPYGVELGVLNRMLKETSARRLDLTLKRDFSRVSDRVAEEICTAAELRPSSNPHLIAT